MATPSLAWGLAPSQAAFQIPAMTCLHAGVARPYYMTTLSKNSAGIPPLKFGMPPRFADSHRIAPNRPECNRSTKDFHNLKDASCIIVRKSSNKVVRQGSRKLRMNNVETQTSARLTGNVAHSFFVHVKATGRANVSRFKQQALRIPMPCHIC
jgi:hypothetical protein